MRVEGVQNGDRQLKMESDLFNWSQKTQTCYADMVSRLSRMLDAGNGSVEQCEL